MDGEFKLGNLTLRGKTLAAPLAGISDLVYREICLEHGAGLTYTEMISTAGLARQNRKTLGYLATRRDRPAGVQLFGKNPEEFARAVDFLAENTDFACIDINMGCPVRKVVSSGSGAALMQNLPLAREIIEITAAKSPAPVTVKFRLGWDARNLNFLELGKIAEQAGAAAVTLHARTRQQAYTGQADWSKIKELAAAVRIPVIGNGDVKNRADAGALLAQTGCAAAMIGRAAIGNPWIFETEDIEPSPQQRAAMYLEHTRRLLQYKPDNEHKTIAEMRKFAARYINGFTGAAELRRKINVISGYAALEKLLRGVLNPA
ncbi:tRNA-dihydrouridine synthase B [Candidatus Termititenax aidoneus]|uniref:tRNA-dihydrouridine synthase n=1 Tax=Termititenax aidoneus TaxID=2218524 RepID=A0A388TCN5_TERA1|nr:tRNA-dihydrouridine synthase B [Candidatus Termititenax aidoneus]